MKQNLPTPQRSRFRRINLKPVNRHAKKLEQASLRHAHTFIVTRLVNLRQIRRHIISWLVLVSILVGLTGLQLLFNAHSIAQLKPTPGGTYAEGMVDTITTLNPLYSTSQAELSANKLIFSGLLKYDSQGQLQTDLAENWRIEEKGTKYIVTLKPHLTWHDGHKLTADDVVATVKAIQDPKTGALTGQSWKDIRVEASNERQVVFTLPGAYAPFASVLTFAILPEHILRTIPPEHIRESKFSKAPIGSGPFRFAGLKTIDITGGKSVLQLNAYDNYWDGKPQVARFILYNYSQSNDLLKGLKTREINAAYNISQADVRQLNKTDFIVSKVLVNNGVYSIFRTDSPFLTDVRVRQGLEQAIDLTDLRRQLNEAPLDTPLISNQLVNATKVKQAAYNKVASQKLLLEAGWKLNKTNGYLEKDGQTFTLKLVTVDLGNYKKIASILSEQWAKVGVKLEIQIVDSDQVQQSVLRPRAYDILVYELEQGGDADNYAYWHSSQKTGAGLNLANYSSPIADDALVTARVRSNLALRDAKYTSFAKAWIKDVPAISLYQPSLRYATLSNVRSLNGGEHLAAPIDRYASVNQWTVQLDSRNTTP